MYTIETELLKGDWQQWNIRSCSIQHIILTNDSLFTNTNIINIIIIIIIVELSVLKIPRINS